MMLDQERYLVDEMMLEKERYLVDEMMLQKERYLVDEMMLEKERYLDDEIMLEKEGDNDDEVMLEKERDKDDEVMLEKERGMELRDEEKYGAYFALEVIRRRDGEFNKGDKQLIADMLKTTVRTIERVWKLAQEQIAKGERVDVSSKKKGHVGRKRKDLGLSRVTKISLNKRRTIRSLAKALGVKRSTLHRKFKWGGLIRHTNTVKPSLTEANKILRLKFCLGPWIHLSKTF